MHISAPLWPRCFVAHALPCYSANPQPSGLWLRFYLGAATLFCRMFEVSFWIVLFSCCFLWLGIWAIKLCDFENLYRNYSLLSGNFIVVGAYRKNLPLYVISGIDFFLRTEVLCVDQQLFVYETPCFKRVNRVQRVQVKYSTLAVKRSQEHFTNRPKKYNKTYKCWQSSKKL